MGSNRHRRRSKELASRNCPKVVVLGKARRSSTSARRVVLMLARRLSRTIDWAISSSRTAQPGGISGNPVSTARSTCRRVPPIKARYRHVEAVVGVSLPDEVEDCEHALALSPAKAASELLQEDRCALRRPQEQDRIDFGDVDPFVEYVDGEDRSKIAAPKLLNRGDASGDIGPAVQCDRWQAGCVELVRHELRMGDSHAKSERAHRLGSRTHSRTASRIRWARM